MRDASKVTIEEERAMKKYFNDNYTAGELALALIPHLSEEAFQSLYRIIIEDVGEAV